MTPGSDTDDLLRRALAAHFRSGGTTHPSRDSAVRTAGGLPYVVLRGIVGTLAVYRVRTVKGQPMLKKLKRWPAELDT
jgi:hypothetical protein